MPTKYTPPPALEALVRELIHQGLTYLRLADELNQRGHDHPYTGRPWTEWSARHICRKIGSTSPRHPKPDSSRAHRNRTLSQLIKALPDCRGDHRIHTLAEKAGVGASTAGIYRPALWLIVDGHVDPTDLREPAQLWDIYQSLIDPEETTVDPRLEMAA